jgi:CHAT domain-containing protein
LQWLWDKCVKVILYKIYEGQKPTPGTLKRIWWVGIGVATSFPFHAAGDHSVDSTEQTTFGWAISSYTPTMKVLNHARVRESMRQYNARQPKLLIVAMPASVGQVNLPGITREISEVETAVSSVFSSNTLIHPDAKTVLDQLNRCDAVHFACHGTSDHIDPFNSSLILQKNTSTGPITDKLTVRQIVDAELETATIAYLSGGSIAENRTSIVQDEVVHLASGFQVAGFSHVIATMWPPTDNDCVEMAKGFYTRLRQIQVGPPSRRGIAEAVHRSTLEIRSRLRATPLSWAPYIHVGV